MYEGWVPTICEKVSTKEDEVSMCTGKTFIRNTLNIILLYWKHFSLTNLRRAKAGLYGLCKGSACTPKAKNIYSAHLYFSAKNSLCWSRIRFTDFRCRNFCTYANMPVYSFRNAKNYKRNLENPPSSSTMETARTERIARTIRRIDSFNLIKPRYVLAHIFLRSFVSKLSKKKEKKILPPSFFPAYETFYE